MKKLKKPCGPEKLLPFHTNPDDTTEAKRKAGKVTTEEERLYVTAGETQNMFCVTSVPGSAPRKGFQMDTMAEDTWHRAGELLVAIHFT